MGDFGFGLSERHEFLVGKHIFRAPYYTKRNPFNTSPSVCMPYSFISSSTVIASLKLLSFKCQNVLIFLTFTKGKFGFAIVLMIVSDFLSSSIYFMLRFWRLNVKMF